MITPLKVGSKAVVKSLIYQPSDYQPVENSPKLGVTELMPQAAEFHEYWAGKAVVITSTKPANSQAVKMNYACVAKEAKSNRTGIFFWQELEEVKA